MRIRLLILLISSMPFINGYSQRKQALQSFMSTTIFSKLPDSLQMEYSWPFSQLLAFRDSTFISNIIDTTNSDAIFIQEEYFLNEKIYQITQKHFILADSQKLDICGNKGRIYPRFEIWDDTLSTGGLEIIELGEVLIKQISWRDGIFGKPVKKRKIVNYKVNYVNRGGELFSYETVCKFFENGTYCGSQAYLVRYVGGCVVLVDEIEIDKELMNQKMEIQSIRLLSLLNLKTGVVKQIFEYPKMNNLEVFEIYVGRPYCN